MRLGRLAFIIFTIIGAAIPAWLLGLVVERLGGGEWGLITALASFTAIAWGTALLLERRLG